MHYTKNKIKCMDIRLNRNEQNKDKDELTIILLLSLVKKDPHCFLSMLQFCFNLVCSSLMHFLGLWKKDYKIDYEHVESTYLGTWLEIGKECTHRHV